MQWMAIVLRCFTRQIVAENTKSNIFSKKGHGTMINATRMTSKALGKSLFAFLLVIVLSLSAVALTATSGYCDDDWDWDLFRTDLSKFMTAVYKLGKNGGDCRAPLVEFERRSRKSRNPELTPYVMKWGTSACDAGIIDRASGGNILPTLRNLLYQDIKRLSRK